MLFFHPHLGLGNDLLTTDFRNLTLYVFLFQSWCHILFLTQSLWTDHRNERPVTMKGPVTEQAVATLKKAVYLLKNTRHEVLHYAIFSSSCYFFLHRLLSVTLSSTPCFRPPSFFFNLRDQILHPTKQQIMSKFCVF